MAFFSCRFFAFSGTSISPQENSNNHSSLHSSNSHSNPNKADAVSTSLWRCCTAGAPTFVLESIKNESCVYFTRLSILFRLYFWNHHAQSTVCYWIIQNLHRGKKWMEFAIVMQSHQNVTCLIITH